MKFNNCLELHGLIVFGIIVPAILLTTFLPPGSYARNTHHGTHHRQAVHGHQNKVHTKLRSVSNETKLMSWEEYGRSKFRNLKWGFSTAAYQIEGAWNVDGKGPSIWDVYTHEDPSPIADNSTGDIACDSYHNYKEDVELLESVGAQIYRFSISWPRIMPKGTKDEINPLGLKYYNDLINELEKAGIEPLVTLSHFDLPQALQDQGGFLNESVIIPAFTNYAEVVFKEFGNRVKRWITFNEPYITCVHGYETGVFPGIEGGIKGPAQSLACAHNLLKAHASAYQLYQSKFKESQKGLVGISLVAHYCDSYPWLSEGQSVAEKKENRALAERAMQEVLGWFAEPLMKGTYPDALKDIYEGIEIPKFDEEWTEKVNGSVDFLGLNHYTTFWLKDGKWYIDSQKTTYNSNPVAPSGASGWLRVEPYGFRKMLRWVQDRYDDPVIYITENGFSDNDTVGLKDTGRINYLKSYIDEMEEAVVKDHVDIQVYTVWSLLDNFEWRMGYTERFGVFWVNFTDPDRERIPKSSAEFLKWKFNEQRLKLNAPKPSFDWICSGSNILRIGKQLLPSYIIIPFLFLYVVLFH